MVSMLATGPKVSDSNPSKGNVFLMPIKNLQRAFIWRGNETLGPKILQHVKDPCRV
jgi:hypothetical protein